MRLIYTVKSVFQLKKSNQRGASYKDFFQAGKSVDSIDWIEPVLDIIQGLVSDD